MSVMEIRLIWISLLFLASFTLVAVLLLRARLARVNKRLASVEEALGLMRLREDLEKEKLNELFNALASLQVTVEILLGRMCEKLDVLNTSKPR